MRDTSKIDTICFTISQDSLGLLYEGKVIKTPFRKQPPFTAGIKGKIRNTYADTEIHYTNGKGETGVLLGLRADKDPSGIRLHLFPDNPILAFRPFKLNSDNFVLYKGMKDIQANIRLSGDENASLWIQPD